MDSILHFHQIGERAVFNLAVGQNGISIRDQMLRAQLFADVLPAWLEKSQSEELRGLPVLVVGGGACGMAVAVLLCSRGQPVHVIDRANEPFNTQLTCSSRWIDPTQYDWPMDHWPMASLVWNNPARFQPPFPWSAGRANDVALRWKADLTFLKPQLPATLTFQGNSFVGGRPKVIPGGALEVPVSSVTNRTQSWAPCRALVIATGFNRERQIPNSNSFQAFPFWMSDTFEQPFCGLKNAAAEGTVLISGTGDGALIDLIRVSTRCHSAKQVLKALGLDNIISPSTLATIHCNEHKTERAAAWCADPEFLGPYWQELHAAHEKAADDILGADPNLRTKVEQLCRRKPQKILLLSQFPWFTCQYALNRFLAILIMKAIGTASIEMRSDCDLVGIRRRAGIQLNSPAGCIGVTWELTIQSRRDPSQFHTETANVVIVRHGLNPDSSVAQLTHGMSPNGALGPRPLLPTHLH